MKHQRVLIRLYAHYNRVYGVMVRAKNPLDLPLQIKGEGARCARVVAVAGAAAVGVTLGKVVPLAP